ncbi:hypothetical protein DFH08DRAFT_959826 [Mycena albidolilacea]|uniref:Uncharacterized protein n=1 Tax=Mycena albidolilacea TaxID=1033008 RepID=A0AAD7A2S5_9AGAR|nr:hypothetical protein DFH08DRAFT_959826 [Mycena albidolilacea]
MSLADDVVNCQALVSAIASFYECQHSKSNISNGAFARPGPDADCETGCTLIKFPLPPQRKSTAFADSSDYLPDLSRTITTFNLTEILVPPSVIVKALGRALLPDPEVKSIMLVHSPAHRGKDRYPLWLATI